MQTALLPCRLRRRPQPAAFPPTPLHPHCRVQAFSQPAHTSSSSPGEYPVDVVDWQARLEAALSSKAAAADESRRRRRERQRIILAAELAQRAGGPAISVPQLTQADRCVAACWLAWDCSLVPSCCPPPQFCSSSSWKQAVSSAQPTPIAANLPPASRAAVCRQQIVRWRRQRAFAVLVAEDRLSGELLGSAAISLAQVCGVVERLGMLAWDVCAG